MLYRIGFIGLIFFFSVTMLPETGHTTRCLFISSYHKGNAWSDGIEKGLRSVLDGHCEIRQFDMDTKRHKDEESKKNAAEKARQLIYDWDPEVVITADDNAAKYLIAPFFRDHDIPFVFCGLNWSTDEYGFPYSNVTGMLEVAPIIPMIQKARQLLPGLNKAYYIGANTLTEQKNLRKVKEITEEMEISLDHRLVEDTGEWFNAHRDAQHSDLIIIGSSAGMTEWNPQSALMSIVQRPSKLSMTNHQWMMPVTLLGFTKIPEEQGEWAGKVALSILHGKNPGEIPIVPNRKWDLWVNEQLLNTVDIELPRTLINKFKKVRD
ncbi:MAG: hypothetical protein GY807_23325 [Gammaproteobacteria bacterium]|nr:hypothetical protein [Gammaproteobacteria bacterium]